MNQYEGMFLFSPTFANPFDNCETEIRRLMERAEAELLFCRKWDERRLAYRIQGHKRGTYVLTYFEAAPSKIAGIERDAQLSENILRLLVLRTDGLTRERMESACQLARKDVSDRPGDRSARAPEQGDKPVEAQAPAAVGVSGADQPGDSGESGN